MPIYYNTAPPTNTTKNTINSIMATLPNIRDFLLLKNLTPQYPYLGTTINGSPKIGQPVLDTMVGSGSNAVPIGLPLETEGILWKEQNVLLNTFKNVSGNANFLTSINYIPDIPYTALFGNAEWPQGIQSYPEYPTEEIKKYGIYGKTVNAKFKKDNVTKNLYLDVDKQIDMADFIDLNPIDVTQQIKGYLDEYGDLNLGGSNEAIQASNIIGSITSGQGLGLAKGGVIPNFDVRTSLAGRVLGAAGAIKDTKLGLIGGQQLALALANNAAFNLQQDILGAMNIQDNVLSLVKGAGFAGFPRPNYSITVPSSNLGAVGDYTSKLLGFTIPRSYMTDGGSIFQSESGVVDNVTRANALIQTTGKGQLQALLNNVDANMIGISAQGYDNPINSTFRSGYNTGYQTGNKEGSPELTAYMYAFQQGNGMINVLNSSDSTIPDLSYVREEKVTGLDGYGFQSPDVLNLETYESENGNHIMKPTFSWSTPKDGKVNSEKGFTSVTIPIDDPKTKKSLLVKTQKLFNSVGMKNIVSRKGEMNHKSSQLEQANGDGISKGNAVLSEKSFDPQTGRVSTSFKYPEDAYCRAWTTYSRYDSIAGGVNGDRAGLVRNDGLYGDDKLHQVPFRINRENSVLEDTGFVKIAPYKNDFLSDDVPRNAKNYMLSIENLAWHDRQELLPKGELGQGDPITGKRGRMMWFPPYDIQISESTSVDWESHKFIGRGENMYTYNNTERSGQLSFKIIVDHSTYTNTFRGTNGPDDHYVASFMAGCIEPDSIWTDKFTVQQASRTATSTVTIPQKANAPEPEIPPGDIYVFFPNDQATLPILYECGVSGNTDGVPDLTKKIDYSVYLSPNYTGPHYGLGTYPSNFTYKTDCANNNGTHKEWPDKHNYGLNYVGPYTPVTMVDGKAYQGYLDNLLLPNIAEYISKKCKHCVVEVTGYASPQGRYACNQQLADSRAKNVANELRKEWATSFGWSEEEAKTKITQMKSRPITKSESKCNPKTGSATDTFACKYDRRVVIHFRYDENAALADVVEPKPCTETTTNTYKDTVRQKFYNETMFFDKLIKTDNFIFDKFREKIQYFHPAFHSTTPEGLNSRLTFLQQCTRQGPTDNMETNNLAFGRAPICILRVGDFYHTKIVIDSLNIDYEPLVWDLNPEGIGVQPMIANVSLSFKFLGGESLYGPINKLQNALSFNYYANTGVYEARADYISQEGAAVEKDGKLTSTGMKLNNGVPSTKEGVIEASKLIDSVKSSDCDPSQIVMNNTTVSNTQPQPVAKTTEPKILGIEAITAYKTTSDSVAGSDTYKNEPSFETKYFIGVRLKSEGIIDDDRNRIISDDELKTFVSKGIKLVLEMTPTPDNESRYEEVIEYDNSDFSTGNDTNTWFLFESIFQMGYNCMYCFNGEIIVDLSKKGNYSLSVYYNNNKIQSIPIIIGDTDFYL